MKKCAFCPQDAVERGGEHIFDDWLNRSFPPSKRSFKWSSSSGETRQYEKRKLDEKIPTVCSDCNNRWMSQLTKRIKMGFESVIVENRSLSLLPSGIALLAAFTFMKAAVAASQLAGDDEPFFTRGDRERLRISLEAPSPSVRMWIAAFRGRALHSGRFVPAVVSTDDPRLAGVEYFTFTYLVGHLLIQLLGCRWKKINNRGLPLPMLRPDPYWSEASIQFWPPDNDMRLTWPPSLYFDDDGLERYIDRFKLPINLI